MTSARQIPRQKKIGEYTGAGLEPTTSCVHGRRLNQFGHRFPRINRSVISELMDKLRQSWGQYKHHTTLDKDTLTGDQLLVTYLVKASAMYAEGREFESRAGIFPDFFLSVYLPCGSRFMLSKFNCSTLGWNTVPSFLYNYLY